MIYNYTIHVQCYQKMHWGSHKQGKWKTVLEKCQFYLYGQYKYQKSDKICLPVGPYVLQNFLALLSYSQKLYHPAVWSMLNITVYNTMTRNFPDHPKIMIIIEDGKLGP